MPLSGSAYVAPTWRNGGPPALDAAELQAISDSIVRNQGKNADQDTLIAALQTAVSGKAKIEVGSYVGTGTYGASNPNSITCSFAPKLVFITSKNVGGLSSFILFWVYDTASNYYLPILPDSNSVGATFSLSGNTLKWYTPINATVQGNLDGIVYCWGAFG